MSEDDTDQSILKRLDAIEKSLPRRTKGVVAQDIPLPVLNARNREVVAELAAEQATAAAVAQKAIEDAFKKSPLAPKRLQKNLR